MKKRILSVVLCIALPLSFCACEIVNTPTEETKPQETIVEQYSKEIINTDPKGIEYEYFFENVEALKLAMKKDPDKYNNATVKVIGSIVIKDDKCYLIDYTATSTNVPSKNASSDDMEYESWKMLKETSEKIEIIISNDAQYAVSETGDFVKLYGTLRLTRDSIYIGSCEYDLIATLDERIEKVTRP